MNQTCVPVGSALPQRRDQLVIAAQAEPSQSWDTSINISRAQDRLWEYFEREQGPEDVRTSLSGAMHGDIRLQHLLFSAMLDSWPRLQKAINEMARRVVIQSWSVIPYAARGDNPDGKAQATAKEIERMIWGMKPNAVRNEAGIEATIRNLVFSYYYGHGVHEIRWELKGMWQPRCTKPVPSRFYGYPSDIQAEGDDRLMFYPTGLLYGSGAEDFPENRFLIAVNAGHATHPAMSAPLRALAPYWLAAVYGLQWFMNFTQLYGIPWRHAEVNDPKDDGRVAGALAEIGSQGYILTRPGTKINILESAKGGNMLPQREMIDLADQQCDTFILGQTLTSGTDGTGSRALGEIHENTLNETVKGVADFVGGIITHQLIPSVMMLNYGSAENAPEFWSRPEEVKDEKAKAERMEILRRIGVPMGKAFVYEDLGVPVPADDEEIFGSQAEESEAEFEEKEEAVDEEQGDEVMASDAQGSTETVDKLAANVMEGLTGVAREWLSPVRPAFERLAALAMSKHVTNEDFVAALQKAQREMPELFDHLNTQTLESAFEDAIGTAMLAGSVKRYEEP
jgi:phage gp29-like protein